MANVTTQPLYSAKVPTSLDKPLRKFPPLQNSRPLITRGALAARPNPGADSPFLPAHKSVILLVGSGTAEVPESFPPLQAYAAGLISVQVWILEGLSFCHGLKFRWNDGQLALP